MPTWPSGGAYEIPFGVAAADGGHSNNRRPVSPDRLSLYRCETAEMSIFVIVHGGFGGGWEWTPVAELLRERGHSVSPRPSPVWANAATLDHGWG